MRPSRRRGSNSRAHRRHARRDRRRAARDTPGLGCADVGTRTFREPPDQVPRCEAARQVDTLVPGTEVTEQREEGALAARRRLLVIPQAGQDAMRQAHGGPCLFGKILDVPAAVRVQQQRLSDEQERSARRGLRRVHELPSCGGIGALPGLNGDLDSAPGGIQEGVRRAVRPRWPGAHEHSVNLSQDRERLRLE